MGWTNLFGRLTTTWWSKNRSSEPSSSSSQPQPVFAVDRTELAVTTAAATVPELSLRELNKATRSFSAAMLIGRRRKYNYTGNTAVYRASLPIGNTGGIKKAAAVAKRLAPPPAWTASEDELLRQQVLVLSRLTHGNVVRLLGYTIDAAAGVGALLFEFADMGTLHDALHGPPTTGEPGNEASSSSNDRPVLSWAQRAGIALDVARGLAYLHDVAGVSHWGISSTNVLLFHGFRAKIADYDLRKQRPEDEHELENARVEPVNWYRAPEYAMAGSRSSKLFDVYSYGVLLLELLTGRKGCSATQDPLRWAPPLVREGRVEGFMDPKLGTQYPPRRALGLAMIALCCLERKAESRPSMADVAQGISCYIVSSEKPARMAK